MQFSVESYYSLAGYFLVMLGIGLFAYRESTDDISGYLLGGRKVSPQVTALSAGASDMSGWMLMGLPGAMFVMGVDAVWIAIGLVIGAWFNYTLVAPRLRVYSEVAQDALTLPEFFSRRFDRGNSPIRIVSAIIIVLFFTVYTSSGLVAGGKLFESALGLSYYVGLIVTLGVVVAYTLLGGFLAVSLTDFVQGCIMFVALVLVPYVAFSEFESGSAVLAHSSEAIQSVDAWWQASSALVIFSSVAWGLGYFGQPHIIVRFMAIRSAAETPVARRIGMSWMTVSIIGALATGFVGAAYVNRFESQLADPETIFIFLAQVLFHPLISGFLLAAILAAIMSTISSQLLVSSSSLTEDIYRAFMRKSHHEQDADPKKIVQLGRLGVVVIALAACVLAMDRSSSILDLVSHAWAGFGAVFGPLVLLSLFWSRLTEKAALWGMITGAVTVMFWSYVPVLSNGAALSSLLYEIVPGFTVSGLTLVVVSLLDEEPSDVIQHTFEEVAQSVKAMATLEQPIKPSQGESHE